MLLRSLFVGIGLWFAALPALAQEARVFFFGNSLIHHLTDSDETTVPHWLALFARAGAKDFAADGVWGFPADFATNLPPEPNWSFAEVTRVMGEGGPAFRRANFDTIIFNPPNFVQYIAPDESDGMPPVLEMTTRVFDWTKNNSDARRFFIYEGWADMSGDYPPSDRQFARWHDYNRGEYHDWYQDYTQSLVQAFPDLEVRLIPVASVLATVLSEEPLNAIPATDLYSDDSPHGTASKYLLAAMVTHVALWGEAPPELMLPDTIHPVIRDNQAAIAARITALTQGAIAPEAAAVVPGDAPSLGFGLAGISDWSTQHPFLDIMKTARPWTGHLPGQWGGVDMAALQAGGHLSPEGWPLSLPPGVTHLETFVLTDQPAGARHLEGDYVLTWAGQGDLSVGGLARDVDMGDGIATFRYEPGPGTVSIAIRATDPADPLRDLRLIRADRAALVAAGGVFNPDWTRHIDGARMVRFMDWMATNGSPQVTWDDRPQVTDFTYGWRGVPVEVMVDLANEIGADPWFTLPHMADDAYALAFAQAVRDGLDPRRHVYAEWSNEVWNWGFTQAHWAAEQATARWGETDDGWMQFAGLRAAQVADIWAGVYADAPDRLTRVLAVHTGWMGLEQSSLEAPLAVAEGFAAPSASFDGYAVTGYFGFDIGSDDSADWLRDRIEDGDAARAVTDRLRDGSFAELTDVLFPYHAQVAADRGLDLLMYEGGSHVTGHGEVTNDDAITAFFTAYNYSPDMAALYADLLAAWDAVGGHSFNAFVDVAPPSRWGSWGALRHLDDQNPRWATLIAHNTPPRWSDRPASDFADGTLVEGSGDIAGTPYADILLGSDADDLFRPGGGDDRIGGGAGVDMVELPGRAADWRIELRDGTVIATGPGGALRLTGVERATFSAEPGGLMPLPGAGG